MTLRPIALLVVAALAAGSADEPDLAEWLLRNGHGSESEIAEVVSRAVDPDRFESLSRWAIEESNPWPHRQVALRALVRLLETEVEAAERADRFRAVAEASSDRTFRNTWLVLASHAVPEADLRAVLRTWSASPDVRHRLMAAETLARGAVCESRRALLATLARDPARTVRATAFSALDPVDVLAAAIEPPEAFSRTEKKSLRQQAFRRLGEIAPPDALPRFRFDAFEALVAEHPRDGDEKKRRARLRETWDRLLRESVHRPGEVAGLVAAIESPRTRQRDRMDALAALAWIGTDEALAAIDRFRASARRRRPHLRPFRLDEAIDHPAPSVRHGAPRPLARTRDETGREWCLLPSPVLGLRRLSIARAADDESIVWEAEIPTGLPWVTDARDLRFSVGEGKAMVAWAHDRRGEEVTFDLDELRRDADGDGMTDLLEELLGLDPQSADTDGDGEDDGVDPWPLEPPRPAGPEREILEAVWSTMAGSSRGRGLVVAPPGQIEGYPGPVLRSTPRALALRSHESDALQLGYRITERSEDRAVVLFSDDHMPAGEVWLRRIRGRWLVTRAR